MAYTPPITESDVRSFLQEHIPASRAIKKTLLGVAGVFAVVAVAYVALNAQALFYINSVTPMAEAQATTAPVVKSTPSVRTTTVTPTATPEAPSIPESTLAYAALGISAPITWDVANDEKTQNSILPNSTIHLAGTAHPGQKGVVAIAGHSSNYPWIKGSFNSVFAPLVKSAVGQTIEINYHDRLFRYRVTKVVQINPDDLSVLNEKDKNEVAIITCVPVGTSAYRLVAIGEQVLPNPQENETFTGQGLTGHLPGDL